MGSKKKQFGHHNGHGHGSLDKNSPEYLEKRMKNNSAVKRSRDKTKAKAVEATTRVQRLQIENEHLRSTVDNMTSELKYLKEMLICQAGTTEYLSPGTEADIEYLLREDTPTDIDKISSVLNEMRRIQSIQRGGESSLSLLDPGPAGYIGTGISSIDYPTNNSNSGDQYQTIHILPSNNHYWIGRDSELKSPFGELTAC